MLKYVFIISLELVAGFGVTVVFVIAGWSPTMGTGAGLGVLVDIILVPIFAILEPALVAIVLVIGL